MFRQQGIFQKNIFDEKVTFKYLLRAEFWSNFTKSCKKKIVRAGSNDKSDGISIRLFSIKIKVTFKSGKTEQNHLFFCAQKNVFSIIFFYKKIKHSSNLKK